MLAIRQSYSHLRVRFDPQKSQTTFILKDLQKSLSRSSIIGRNRIFKDHASLYESNPTQIRSVSSSFSTRCSLNLSESSPKMRKVVEHVTLFKMQDDLEVEKEQEFVDYLWSLQYHQNLTISISIGKLISKNSNFSHAMIMRFANLENISQYNSNVFVKQILDNYVNPYCVEKSYFAFEDEVEDDIEQVFRRGDDFESGIEHIVLMKVKADVADIEKDKMIQFVKEFPLKMNPLITQLTLGSNLLDGAQSSEFTHGMVVRLQNEEDLKLYNKHPFHREILRKNILPIIEKLAVYDYTVDPVGNTV